MNGTELAPETDHALKPGDRVRFGHVDAIFDPENAAEGAQELPADVDRSIAPAAKSIKPSNFMNASPFQKRVAKQDTVGIAIMAVGILATLAAIAALVMARQMSVS